MQNENIQIVPFTPEHFQRIRLRVEDAADLSGIDADALVRGWADGRTILKGGEVMFFYGYVNNGGVVTFWAVTGERTGELGLFLTRLARAGIRELLAAGAHRIEAYCHHANRRSLRWLTKSLGMRVEGLVRKSGPNRQDRFLLSIVEDDI